MAVDESLLKFANETGQGTLRFYQWSRPTLSLGYFQKSADRGLHPSSEKCAMVRRSSGGGAIVHDLELTYSLSLPGTNRWSSKQNDLYGSVHDAIIKFLNQLGVSARQFEFPVKDAEKHLEPSKGTGYAVDASVKKTDSNEIGDNRRDRFLCFERRSPGDIVLDGHKIGGSAQRRFSNATLQHGSLLLNRSANAPELLGLSELTNLKLVAGEIVDELADAFASELKMTVQLKHLSATQKKIAEEIRIDKYENADWTLRR